jgi:NADH-quinone oxidoreductase subunit G
VVDGDLESARALIGDGVVAIVGRGSIGESAAATVEAAAVLLDARADARFLVALRRGNVRGAIDMGLAPGLLPGRVTLDDGSQWFNDHWPSLPSQPGLDATGILTAAAAGRIDVLVLLGADPMSDFRDHELAQRALAGARTVIAVDTFLTASSEKADVVLAAAGYAETEGTTTNIEGRVSRLSRKVTPPGTARPDWILAADIANRLGADLGLESVVGIWDEIEELAPAHAGITRQLLESPAADDGVLVPLRPEVARAAEGRSVRITGVEGSTPDSHALAIAAEGGEPEREPVPEAVEAVERAEEQTTARPSLARFTRDAPYEQPGVDAYSLRLIATRKLFDHGTLVQHSPSLAALTAENRLLVHPSDLERLGVPDGGRVKVTSSRTSQTIDAHASTAIPKGSAALVVNQVGPDPADFIDATHEVTDIRIETVS